MTKIGLLSDTHGYLHEKLYTFFSDCHEIWHAGDIGNKETADSLAAIKPLRAVYGNIDGHELRCIYKEKLWFECEQQKIFMTHIGGYPGRYYPEIRKLLHKNRPDIFICGHSHILKVIYDNEYKLLHINPGAAGIQGMQLVSTAIRFTIDGNEVKEMEILEIPRKKVIH